MSHVKVVASWVPSVTKEVASQELVWVVDGVEASPVVLTPDVTTQELTDDVDGKKVGVKVTVVGTNGLRSDAVTAEVDVPPAPVAPAAVTGLTLNVVPLD